MKYTFSILLLSVVLMGHGQFDSTSWGPKKWAPSLFRVGGNAFRLVESGVSETRLSYEIMAEMDFHKYFIVGEYGWEKATRGNSFDYSSQGTFFRIGIDQNMIPYDPNQNVLSLGLRYAYARFEDDISFEHTVLTGPQELQFKNSELTASWIELTLGMRARVLKNLMMGYQVRGKLFKVLKGEGELETFDIPGFGRHKRSGKDITRSTVRFDYYIYWNIPFRKKYIPPKPLDR